MNLLICGYYGFDNAGDELILENLINAVRASSPGVLIKVLSNSPGETSLNFKVNAVNRWNPFSVLAALVWSDAVITGGGGLFQDKTSSLSLYYYCAVIFLAKLLNKKIFITAVTVNDLKPFNRAAALAAFKAADSISVREKGSLELLNRWGLKGKEVLVAADLVFAGKHEPSISANPKPVIVFALRESLTRPYDKAVFAAAVRAMVSAVNAQALFIPFHKGQDERFIAEIAALAGFPASVVTWKDILELTGCIKNCDIIVTQRLHALILAVLYGKPVTTISEDQKLIRFCEENSLGRAFSPAHLEENELSENIKRIYAKKDEIRIKSAEKAAGLKTLAERSISVLFED